MTEQLPGTFYDYPRYYDLVYGSDWKAERDFLVAVFEQHASRRVKRLLEPACGSGRLLLPLARAGFLVSGLDLNPAMVEYCNRRLDRHGFGQPAWVGDMSDFELTAPVDAAFNTINSFRHLEDHQQAVGHLESMVDAVAVGGLYVLGLHLTPTARPATEDESWSARRGHLAVQTSMQLIDRNLSRRRERYRMSYDIWTPTRHAQLVDEFNFRTYTAEQFQSLLAEVPALEVVAMYDFSYDLKQPLELDASSEDVVFVLRVRG
jgi:SAM-dependent methyltransferase